MLALGSRLLDMRPGEGARVLRMFSLLALIIGTGFILKPVRSALFLSELGAARLPYVYILVALVLGVVAAVFARFAPRTDLPHLFVALSCLFSLSLVGFWYAVTAGYSWTGYLFYVWVSIFTALMPSLFWLLANYVFYANEGRRLFPVVTAGGLLGSIIGGTATSVLVSRVGTAGLLLVAALSVALIAIVVRHTATRERTRISERRADLTRQERVRAEPQDDRPLATLARSRYLAMLTTLVVLAGIASTILDYQFNTVVGSSFGSRDELTRFFGSFFAFISVVAFCLQLFLAGRILSRLGILVGLALLPLALFAASLSFLIRPSLVTASLLKTSDDGLGNSIHRSSVEVLYLPVALAVKNRIKAWVDLFVERMSRGVAGLVILGASELAVGVHQLSLVLLAILVPWLWLVGALRRAYVETLKESIARRDITDLASVLRDPESLRVFRQVLASGDPKEALYALELLQGTDDPVLLEDALRLSAHESPALRTAALRVLKGASSPPSLPDFARSLGDKDPAAAAETLTLLLRVDREAGETELARWVEAEDIERLSALLDCLDERQPLVSRELLARIADRYQKSGASGPRALAAKAIGFLPVEDGDMDLTARLSELITDGDVEVARAAVTSAGRRRAPESLGALVVALGRAPLRVPLRTAIARFGPQAVDDLERFLANDGLPERVRLALPRAIAEIEDQRSVFALLGLLPAANPRFHYQAIKGLSRLRKRGRSVRFPRAAVDEILEYERSLLLEQSRVLAALRRSPTVEPSYRLLQSVLEERIEFTRERIFRLLGLVYPQREMASVWSRIGTAEPSVRATALEYLANLLSRRHRRSLFTLLEAGSEPSALGAGRDLLGESAPPLEEALGRLIPSGDDWLVACAITVVGRLRLASLVPVLRGSRDHESPVVREAVRQALDALTALPGTPRIDTPRAQ